MLWSEQRGTSAPKSKDSIEALGAFSPLESFKSTLWQFYHSNLAPNRCGGLDGKCHSQEFRERVRSRVKQKLGLWRPTIGSKKLVLLPIAETIPRLWPSTSLAGAVAASQAPFSGEWRFRPYSFGSTPEDVDDARGSAPPAASNFQKQTGVDEYAPRVVRLSGRPLAASHGPSRSGAAPRWGSPLGGGGSSLGTRRPFGTQSHGEDTDP